MFNTSCIYLLKSVVTERFIKDIKNKVHKYIPLVSKNVYVGTLADIEIKPADIKSTTYIDFNNEGHKEDPNCEVSDNVIRSKYKNIFAKELHFKLVSRFLCA